MDNNRLLISEYPLVVLPSLAKAIGLNESIILQQIHYWLQTSQHIHNNKKWVYNSYAKWQEQFPFWSLATIKRTILSLEKNGYIISRNFNQMKIDRTKWYTIDYNRLASIGSNCTNGQVKLTPPIPETTTDNTKNIKDLQKLSPSENPFLKEKDFKDLKTNGADEDGGNDAAITAAFRVYEQELGVKMGTALRVWSRPFVILILKDHTIDDIRNAIQNWAAVIKSEGKQPAQFINFKSLGKMIDFYKDKKKVRRWR